MKLIEVYIHEVTRRLPEKLRADIGLELQSTIEDMLPEHYDEDDVKVVLNQLGSPAALANGYKDQPMHLIGPRYYDLYVSLLKMIVPIAAVIAFISITTEYLVENSNNEVFINLVVTIIVKAIGTIIEVSIQVFFWLTLIFAIIERFDKDKDQQPLTTSLEKWTADHLKKVAYVPKKKAISKFEVFGGLLWTGIWATLYFNANQLLGVYEGEGSQLQFVMPALNQDTLLSYWPIVIVLIIIEIAFSLYKLFKEQWTKKVAIFNTIVQVVAIISFLIIFMNPNLLNEAFITYMIDVFTITQEQFNTWLVGGIVLICVISTAVNIYDGFKKARISS